MNQFSFLEEPYCKMPEATLGALFFDRAKNNPDKIFLSTCQEKKNWSEIAELVENTAHYLLEKGIKKGDLIAIISANSIDMIIFILSVLSIGAVCCPLHSTLSQKQKEKLLKDYPYQLIALSKDEFLKLKNILSPDIGVIQLGSPLPLMSAQKKIMHSILETIHPSDLAYIILSSGTTGIQKGILLSHDNILSNQRQVMSLWRYPSRFDKYFLNLPFICCIGPIILIIAMALWVYAIYTTIMVYNDKDYRIPVMADLADKIEL